MLHLPRTLIAHAWMLAAVGLAACSGRTQAGSSNSVLAGASCATSGAQALADDGCNTCSCSGGSWSCTERDCAVACDEGVRHDDGCNACECTGGAWSCTDESCASGGSGAGQGGASASGGAGAGQSGGSAAGGAPTNGGATTGGSAGGGSVCVDGETGDDGCNSCWCEGGQWACTDMYCPPAECDPASRPGAGGECNRCSCDAGGWVCTPAPCPACPAPVVSGEACIAVIAFVRDPISGVCCEYGDPCSAPEGWLQFGSRAECEGPTASCTPGATRPSDDGCNTCICGSDGGWACTARACAERCVPGQTRRDADGCNTCTCGDGGGWTCTDRSCSPGESIGCGGWLGQACTDDEYCAYEVGQRCGAADASSTCEPRPSVCTREYAPVCGCDSVTYSNACGAAAAGTGVLATGECGVSLQP